jgi:predicted DNA-binding transcriptional regulator AlpA
MDSKTIYQVNGEDLMNFLTEIQEQIATAKQKEEHYTREQAEKVTGKSRTTLYLWEQQGYLTPVRMGKTLLYLKSDIDRIMNTKRKD